MSNDTRIPDKTFTKEEINVYPFPGVKLIDLTIGDLNSVAPTIVDWLWKDILAVGKITLFAGEPGVGKSQLLLYIAHILSNGSKFHFESTPVKPIKILLISGEDSINDTVIPRLLALGANLSNIHYLKGIRKEDKKGQEYYEPLSLGENISELEEKIIQNDYKVVIIDPISVYLGSADENKNKEIRSVLAQLTALCERREIAIILNSHFTKPSGNIAKNAIYRVMGSVGFGAAARIVYGIMKDPENPERRLFLPIKNNIAQDKEGFVFTIKFVKFMHNKMELQASKIEWLNEKVVQTANEILNSNKEVVRPKFDEACQFLLKMLKDGSVPLATLRTEAQKLGITPPRLYEAKEALNIYETTSIAGKRGKIWMYGA